MNKWKVKNYFVSYVDRAKFGEGTEGTCGAEVGS